MCWRHVTHPVEQRDADVLDDAVQSHELEHTEGCNESSPTFSVNQNALRIRKLLPVGTSHVLTSGEPGGGTLQAVKQRAKKDGNAVIKKRKSKDDDC